MNLRRLPFLTLIAPLALGLAFGGCGSDDGGGGTAGGGGIGHRRHPAPAADPAAGADPAARASAG